MFDIGAGEIIGLGLLGLILFGPDRLPTMAADLAKNIRKVRAFASSATSELKESLGPEITSLPDLNPRNITREMTRSLLEPEAQEPAKPRIDPDAT